MTPRHAAIYVHVSTEGRDGFGSLRAQEGRLLAHSGRMGWEVVERFVDEAGGESLQRPGLMQLQAKAQVGAFDVLVVATPGELFVNPERVKVFVSSLRRQYGVDVVFVEPTQAGDAA